MGIVTGVIIIFISMVIQQNNKTTYGLSIPKMVSIYGSYILLGVALILALIKKYYQPQDAKTLAAKEHAIITAVAFLYGLMLIIAPARLFVY